MNECPPHHWLIDSPRGRLSAGKCRKCGAERTWEAPIYSDNDRQGTYLHDPLPKRTNVGEGAMWF